jgi:serine/threonine protein kinase
MSDEAKIKLTDFGLSKLFTNHLSSNSITSNNNTNITGSISSTGNNNNNNIHEVPFSMELMNAKLKAFAESGRKIIYER